MRILNTLARAMRTLPDSRTKVRTGRVVAAVVSAMGFDPRTVTMFADGSRMLLDPRSRTEAGAFWNGSYEAAYVKLLCDLSDIYGPVSYDIGANVGLIAIPLAQHVRERSGHVVCFEPVPENHERLMENLRLNDLTHVCDVFAVALGASEGQAQIVREAALGATTDNAVIVGNVDSDRSIASITVDLTRLDAVVAHAQLPAPSVIKLDVEGYEVGVLAGAHDVLTNARPVILGEFHSGLMPRFGHTFLDATSLLPPEYAVFGFIDERTVVEKVPAVGLGDVLLVPHEKVGSLPLRIAPV